jgi:CheY-like chemotaxis protein
MSSRILIVEDEPLLGAVILQKLRAAGYDADLAHDGREALEKLRAQKPALLVLDAIVPIVSGMEVLARKQEDPELRPIPVLMLTNSYHPSEGTDLAAMGIKKFMVKSSVTPDEVLAAVAELAGPGFVEEKAVEPVPLIGKKVLLVEDDDFLAKILSSRLAAEEAVVLYSRTGEEAMSILANDKPDVALLDILLPGVSGLEVLDRIRADDATRSMPVVMISNFNQDVEKRRAQSQGAHYLVKAMVNPDDIVGELKLALGRR